MNNDILRVLIAIFVPPVGVLCQTGVKNPHFWLNLIAYISMIGYPIALIHALWVILKSQDD